MIVLLQCQKRKTYYKTNYFRPPFTHMVQDLGMTFKYSKRLNYQKVMAVS